MKDPSTLNIQRLPLWQKLQLIEELSLSMEPDLESIGVFDEEKKILTERWEAYLRDPSLAITQEEFKQRIKADRQWYKSVSSRRLSKT